MTDRHPNPLFSACIISPNVERKIMQTNCVRKTGAVFFGSREIIRGNLTRAKSTRCIIKPETSSIKNNAACFRFNNAPCFTCIYPLQTCDSRQMRLAHEIFHSLVPTNTPGYTNNFDKYTTLSLTTIQKEHLRPYPLLILK